VQAQAAAQQQLGMKKTLTAWDGLKRVPRARETLAWEPYVRRLGQAYQDGQEPECATVPVPE